MDKGEHVDDVHLPAGPDQDHGTLVQILDERNQAYESLEDSRRMQEYVDKQ